MFPAQFHWQTNKSQSSRPTNHQTAGGFARLVAHTAQDTAAASFDLRCGRRRSSLLLRFQVAPQLPRRLVPFQSTYPAA
jgi:hypothetical protein